ncbi:MAG: phytanoyl-CoA dioxygenase family protein [Planctomycetota bacterium]|nr:phytanoyl-CoA dioxygenase family protein [Planctomycetota bacterium]
MSPFDSPSPPIDRHRQFDDEGFLFLGKVLTGEQVSAARANLAVMLAQLHSSLQADEIYSAHQQEPWLLEIATTPIVLDAVEQILGPHVVLWSTHLICKPPRTGRAIPWHQDGTYWNLSGPMVSVWLAFDDADDENGTMYVLPGHHKQILGRRETGSAFFDEEIQPTALPADIAEREVEYRLKAGEAAMHHVLIPHRSPPNRSADRWRRVVVLRYMSADGEMGAKQYPNFRTAQLFDREYILVRGSGSRSPGLVTLADFRQSLDA